MTKYIRNFIYLHNSVTTRFLKILTNIWIAKKNRMAKRSRNAAFEPRVFATDVALELFYNCADPLHAESNPHAVSESESLFCCVFEAVEPTAVVEVGRRCICWLDRETFPWRSGVVGWLAAWCSRDELKSWARRLLLFLIGAYFGGGIIFWSN